MSTEHNFWRERRAEADLNRGPSAYQPNASPLGQTGSQPKECSVWPYLSRPRLDSCGLNPRTSFWLHWLFQGFNSALSRAFSGPAFSLALEMEKAEVSSTRRLSSAQWWPCRKERLAGAEEVVQLRVRLMEIFWPRLALKTAFTKERSTKYTDTPCDLQLRLVYRFGLAGRR